MSGHPKDRGVNHLSFEMDLTPRAEKEEWQKHLEISVTSFTGNTKVLPHFSLTVRPLVGEEQFLAEELSLKQLKRLYDFIGLALKMEVSNEL